MTQTIHDFNPTEWPAPVWPPPPPAPRRSGKKWAFGLVAGLVALGVIGAVTERPGTSDAELNKAVNDAQLKSLDSNGDLDEATFVENSCAAALDFRDDGSTRTYRQQLAEGDVTVYHLADIYAKAYLHENDLSDLSRAEVVQACSAGLRNF